MSNVLALLQGNKLIDIDKNGQIEQPVLVLSSRGGNKIGVIKNVSSINITHPLADVAELSFDVTKEVDGEAYGDWDEIKDFRFIQMPYDNTWFEATVSIDEENEIVKHVTCVHANEAELGQLNLYETEINTENDIGRDDYVETVFYNENNPKASLLHRILKDKAPHYQIYHVDDSLKDIFRVFSFNGESIHDALNRIAEEVNCLFVYGEWDENDGKYHRTISAYDLEDYCQDCQTRGEYTNGVCTNCGSTNIVEGYGEDTGIFISKENLAQSINYDSNTDNVKNCFRLSAGDDVMTSAIKSCNPSMSQYMWHFSDDMLEDMSDELATKITEYEALVESYKKDREIDIPSDFIESSYNSLVDKYGDMNEDLVKITTPIKGTAELTEAYYNALNMYGFLKSELMPVSEKVTDTTATEQLALLQDGDFTEVGVVDASGTIPYTTANSAIQSYAKVYIDTSRYKVSVFTNSIDNKVWTGTITVTAYRDDEDTATDTFTITLFDSTDNAKYADWLTQSVQKTMASREASDVSVVNLFKTDEDIVSFKNRLKLYSIDYLNIMLSMATSAITVLSEQGVASQDTLDADIYTQLYLPYLEKSRAIQNEIAVREIELSGLLQPTDEDGVQNPAFQNKGLIDIIEEKQNEIRESLDLHDYLGDTLWEELSFYRRESEYSNQNYISDGLTDSEVVEQAQNFIEVATKEIIKASTLQHTISAPLSNFLLLEEFNKLQEKFRVGNWIWLRVDGKVYKLRLSNWEIDYDNIDDLDIEFTDAIRVGDTISDVESVLSKSRSMATTYDYTARQADKGKDASETVQFFKDSGIDFKAVKAIVSRGNTNIVYDDDGILLKRVDGFRDCPEQARIYNNGIYITRDAWETVSTGLGHFSYVDPETGETVDTYGIIADTVIGKLILGENLKIYSESGKFEMGDDGLKVTAIDGEDNSDLFVIQKQKTDEQGRPYVEKYIYVDSNGDVKIAGNSITISGKPISEYIDDEIGSQIGDQIDDARKVATNYLAVDNTGIMVADMQNGEQTPSTATGKNVFIDSESVQIRNGQNTLSSFGNNQIVLGEEGKSRLELSSSAICGVTNTGVKNFEIINGDSGDAVTYNETGSFNNTSEESNKFNGTFIVNHNIDLRNIESMTVSATWGYNIDGVHETSTIRGTINKEDYKDGEVPMTAWIMQGSSTRFSSTELLDLLYDTNGFSLSTTIRPKGATQSIIIDSTATYSISIITNKYQDASFTFGSRIDSNIGANSCVIGEQLMASSRNQVAIGRCNKDDLDKQYLFMVGNGISGIDRNNAFSVDWSGVAEAANLKLTESMIHSNSEENFIKCTNINEDDVFTVTKTGDVTIANDLNIGGDININDLSIDGDISATGDIDSVTNINATGNSTIGGTSTITGKLTANGGVDVVGNIGVTGDVDVVNGGISTTGDLDVGGDVAITGNTTITGNTGITGNLDVVGTITGNSLPLLKVQAFYWNPTINANSAFTSYGFDVTQSGYTALGVVTFGVYDQPTGGRNSSWCVVPKCILWGGNTQTLDLYVWNQHPSQSAVVTVIVKVLYALPSII